MGISFLLGIVLLTPPTLREIGLERTTIVVDVKQVVPADDFLTFRDLQNIHAGIALERMRNLRSSN